MEGCVWGEILQIPLMWSMQPHAGNHPISELTDVGESQLQLVIQYRRNLNEKYFASKLARIFVLRVKRLVNG